MDQDKNKKKVLVVDDEPNMRRLLHSILSDKFVIYEADNGQQAIDVANTIKPDVILMDMMMPKVDGLTACLAIKNNPATKSIPVIMVTGTDFELNIKLSKQMGATGYITKPFFPKDLLDKIAKVFEIP